MADAKFISQEEIDTLVTKYFIRSSISLHHIDRPYFKNIFSVFNFNELGLNIMNRKSLETHIEDRYTKVRAEIKNKLKNIKHVSINAEHIWRYLIVTCHWIDSDLKRQSVTLACRPTSGTNITVKECTESYLKGITVLNDYKIYFVENQERSAKHGWFLEDGVLLLTDIEGLDFKSQVQYSLKEPFECHEVRKIRSTWYRIWDAAENKETAQVMQNIIGYTLTRPKNDSYDFIEQVVSVGQDKYNELVTVLEIKNPLQDEDFAFAAEYLKLYKPLKEAFSILEDHQNSFYGNLLPCLLSLRKKLTRFLNEKDQFVHCKPLPLLGKLELNFSELFKLETDRAMNAALAAISYPKFKEKWFCCVDSYHHENIREAFEQAVIEEMGHLEQHPDKEDKKRDDFFDFDEGIDKETKVKRLVTRYLTDKDVNLSMLNRHKEIKKVFMKYNTPLPVKRYKYIQSLFDIVTPNLNKKYSEELVQKIVFLKCNDLLL